MKRAGLFVAVVLAGLLFRGSLRADERPEPRYEGKPLEYWVERLQKSETREQRWQAEDAIKAFGPDAAPAVPALVKMLDDRSEDFRHEVAHLRCDLGPAAKVAVPELVKSLRAKTARSPDRTIDILSSIGPDAKEAVPILLTVTEDRKLRVEAVRALCKIDPSSKDVLPAIQQAVRDELSRKEDSKLSSLVSELAPLKGGAVPLLIEALEKKDWFIKRDAITALGEIGPPAKAACPTLMKMLEDNDSFIRREAARALWLIDKNTAGVPVLTELLNPKTNRVDWLDVENIAELLGDMGAGAKSARPRLEEWLDKYREGDDFPRLVATLESAIKKIRADKPQK